MLDNKFRRLALLMEPDIVRMLERQSQRIVGHDDVKWDEGHHVVAYYRHGTLIWAARGELVGSFTPELGLFRWWFLNRGTSPAAKLRLDEAYREGQRYALSELTLDQVYVDNEPEADLIADHDDWPVVIADRPANLLDRSVDDGPDQR